MHEVQTGRTSEPLVCSRTAIQPLVGTLDDPMLGRGSWKNRYEFIRHNKVAKQGADKDVV